MTLTLRRSVCFSLALLFFSVSVPINVSAEEASLRLSTSLSPHHFAVRQVLQPFVDHVYENTKGRLSIRIFGRGELARTSREQLDLIDQGLVDLALIVPTVAEGRFPEMGFVALPNLIPDTSTGSWLLTEMYFNPEVLLRGGFYFERVIPIGFFVTPPNLLHSNREIRGLHEIRGMKVRTGNREVNSVLTMLGASPVMLPSSDVFNAASQGLIDSAAMSWEQYRGLKASAVMRFSMDINLGGSTPVLLVMDRRRFLSLPGYQQDAIISAGGHWIANRWGQAYDREALRIRSQSEGSLTSLEKEEMNEFSAIADELHDIWRGRSKDRYSALDEAKGRLQELKDRK